MLDSLTLVAGGPVRVWRVHRGEGASAEYAWQLVGGDDPGWRPDLRPGDAPWDAPVPTPDGPRWWRETPGVPGTWIEWPAGRSDPAAVEAVLPLIGRMLAGEQETFRLSEELASRYEEIDLLYSISDVLGRTVRLEEAARFIVHEVSEVVGARRASILVHDPEADLLRPVAARGFELAPVANVPTDDPCSIAARVFRTRTPMAGEPGPGERECEPGGRYQSGAYLSVPICYGRSGGPQRCVGVINLTERTGAGDRFSTGDRKLVEAIANQIGAALENARLVTREREQQRLRDELALARELQLRLLPRPSDLLGDASVAVRCLAAESVGGDFYTFARLGHGRIGVMIGDVASHGYGAALVMALVLAAAGIHSTASVPPDEALAAIRGSLASKLSSADTYFSIFYGMLDPRRGTLSYASAGHPYVYRLPASGDPERLEATAPPLGLTAGGPIGHRSIPWHHQDLLCLWTDGLVDLQNAGGERFGEARLLATLGARRLERPEAIVEAVFADADAFGGAPADDRTLLVLRL